MAKKVEGIGGAKYNPEKLKYELVEEKPTVEKAATKKGKLEKMAEKVLANPKGLESSDAGRQFRLTVAAASEKCVVGSAAKTWAVGLNDLETLMGDTLKSALKEYFTLSVASGVSLADLSEKIIITFALTELKDNMFMPEVPAPNMNGVIEEPDHKLLMTMWELKTGYPKGLPAGVNTPTKAVKMVTDKMNDYKFYAEQLISYIKDPKPYDDITNGVLKKVMAKK